MRAMRRRERKELQRELKEERARIKKEREEIALFARGIVTQDADTDGEPGLQPGKFGRRKRILGLF